MRSLFLICVAILLFFESFGQDSTRLAMETTLPKLKGAAYVEQALAIARDYVAEGHSHKTTVFAEKAVEVANTIGSNEGKAEGLFLQGAALLLLRPERATYRTRAAKYFRDAYFLTSSKELKIEIMEAERALAFSRNRDKEVEVLDVLLSVITGEVSPIQASKNPLFSANKRARDILKTVASENIALNQQVDSLEQQQAALEQQQAELDLALAEKEEAIMSMSEATAKAELLAAQKEMLVDSLENDALIKSMQLDQQQMQLKNQEAQLALQQSEIELQASRTNFFIALAGIIFLIAFGLLSRFLSIRNYNRTLQEKNTIIANEQQRSEGLLLNILPATVARELKERGAAQARQYDQVSVLFVDFKNFSKIASQLTPGELVDDLDFCFRHFDEIVQEYGLEKIKTIGDAYMCAGGLPDPNPDHVSSVIGAALAMQTFLHDWKLERL
ncbi:MAG: hypothetical protein KDC44_18285, partial [Phaeodactylibacter sp.]|nr:hypothetical protein [Phaeodactylibacter sp.]